MPISSRASCGFCPLNRKSVGDATTFYSILPSDSGDEGPLISSFVISRRRIVWIILREFSCRRDVRVVSSSPFPVFEYQVFVYVSLCFPVTTNISTSCRVNIMIMTVLA